MRAFVLVVAFSIAGCLGSAPDAADAGGNGATLDTSHDGGASDALASDGAAVPVPVDAASSIDFAGADLTGLVNCYNATACDPTSSFCIRYFAGSQSTPGKLTVGPACFEPSDTCANQNQPMDCNCIQNDMTLGPSCQGSCVDHMDGTFDCYAM